MNGPTVLIMAAGEGTRMRSATPKVLHEVCGRPMISWPVRAARDAGAGRIAVIVPPERDLSAALGDGVETVVQPEPDGTGGAVRAALPLIRDAETVVVLSGDHPLISAEIVSALLDAHRAAGAAATVMSVDLDDPSGYGRIVRDDRAQVERIVETKHAEAVAPEHLAIHEINTGTYAFEAQPLAEALAQLEPDAEVGEYYIGDVLPVLRAAGHGVAVHKADDQNVNLGVNTRADLARAASEARRRLLERHMLAGVTIVDPSATWIDADVEIEPDAVIEPGCTLRGSTRIGGGSIVGPHTTIVDSTLDSEVRAPHSYITEAVVGAGCSIGPFSHLRPGTVVGEGVKVGAFVEIKNSNVGDGAKVPHLSYVGDADVGAGANLGAGTITANYDGFRKSRTKIGERARTGVHTSLVAPVSVGEDAYTGAGAVIREDLPAGALGVSRVEQRNIEGYAERKAAKAGGRTDAMSEEGDDAE